MLPIFKKVRDVTNKNAHLSFNSRCYHFWANKYSVLYSGGACGVMVIVIGNGHGDMSSNPGLD